MAKAMTPVLQPDPELDWLWRSAAADWQTGWRQLTDAVMALFAETTLAQVRAARRSTAILARQLTLPTPHGVEAWTAEIEEAGRGTLRDLGELSRLTAGLVGAAMRPVTEFLPGLTEGRALPE
jgi:hypothetical protein